VYFRRRANRNKETSTELGLDNLGQPQPANAASKPTSVFKKSISTARPPSTARPRSANHGEKSFTVKLSVYLPAYSKDYLS